MSGISWFGLWSCPSTSIGFKLFFWHSVLIWLGAWASILSTSQKMPKGEWVILPCTCKIINKRWILFPRNEFHVNKSFISWIWNNGNHTTNILEMYTKSENILFLQLQFWY
jgi:hypothetical protein